MLGDYIRSCHVITCNMRKMWGLIYLHAMRTLPTSYHVVPDRIPAKKEPCLTPTLRDEGQARNPNTTYNGYIMEFWKFALTWKLICQVQHK